MISSHVTSSFPQIFSDTRQFCSSVSRFVLHGMLNLFSRLELIHRVSSTVVRSQSDALSPHEKIIRSEVCHLTPASVPA
ncbi:hypothetical protein RRG08_021298 [Elysia crispata]|uniref:Uncharacterized protein n=1 Tax=Elysia crispata TaxID=231223 RepID=A0AAE0ZA20_9GAST|nr:hypothetical protein RRG08_021298 [Elysia crispata]